MFRQRGVGTRSVADYVVGIKVGRKRRERDGDGEAAVGEVKDETAGGDRDRGYLTLRNGEAVGDSVGRLR